MLRYLAFAAATAALAGCATAPAPFDDADHAAFDAFYDAKVADGERAGYVVGVMKEGRLAHVGAYGLRDIATGAPMTRDTRFRIASMSKPITSVAVMMLVEDGLVSLDDPVTKYVPEFANAKVATDLAAGADGGFDVVDAEQMTVRHLITHTSGLGYLFDFETDLGKLYLSRSLYDGDGALEEEIASLADLPLYFQPGERWYYSWADDVLGRVVEVASGRPFETFLAEEIFEPLGMTATEFFPDAAEIETLADVYTHDDTGALVADPSFDQEAIPTWPSGGGGLISSADDYMHFAAMMLNGGALDGVRLLEPETVAAMTTPEVDPAKLPETFVGIGYGYGFGVITDAEASRYEGDAAGDFFWGGYFGTEFYVSPERGVVAVVMTQNLPTPTSRPSDTRGDLYRLVTQALAE